MNRRKRRRGKAPIGVRAAALAVTAILAIALAVLLTRLVRGALGFLHRGDAGKDPQFAEPTEYVTRPPEMTGEGKWPGEVEDPSTAWEQGEQTPVDKTAEELAREAAMP